MDDSDGLEALEVRFRRIARTLPADLLGADDDAILADLGGDAERLLGFYTQDGVERALEAYGVFDTLRARGYSRFSVSLDLDEFTHDLRVYADDYLVCECRLRQARGATDPCFAEWQRRFVPELLVVEWLSLEDQRRQFDARRPRLPGQRHPGSGVGAEVMTLLTLCARRLKLHGLIEVPERFHNAVIYRRRTHFFDPIMEGRFLALVDLLEGRSLNALAWAMERGAVIDTRTGEPVAWPAREQVCPLDGRLWDYFELPAWRSTCAAERQAMTGCLIIEPAKDGDDGLLT